MEKVKYVIKIVVMTDNKSRGHTISFEKLSDQSAESIWLSLIKDPLFKRKAVVMSNQYIAKVTIKAPASGENKVFECSICSVKKMSDICTDIKNLITPQTKVGFSACR